MFSFSWSEIAMIAVVALVLIGPKDLPAGLKTVAQLIRKVRGMAGEFQGHMDDLLKDADLGDIREQINEIRHFDIKGAVERAVDPDHSISRTLNEDPFSTADATTAPETVSEGNRPEDVGTLAAAPILPAPEDADLGAPSFIPPDVVVAVLRPPAFVPPELLSTRA